MTQVTHISENTTRREHAGHQLGCFYSGSVDGDPTSAVSVSLCHGMVSSMTDEILENVNLSSRDAPYASRERRSREEERDEDIY